MNLGLIRDMADPYIEHLKYKERRREKIFKRFEDKRIQQERDRYPERKSISQMWEESEAKVKRD